MSDIHWRRYPDFSPGEFACCCGCGTVNVQPALLSHLQAMRDMLGRPMVVTSGCRCASHNDAVSTATPKSASPHLGGWAADIAVRDRAERYAVVDAALAVGVKRIGVGKSFVHIDVAPHLDEGVLWTY